MCIIIYKPKGKTVGLDVLLRCWKENPDGAGFMFIHGKQVNGSKGFMEYKDLIKRLKEVGAIKNSQITGRYDMAIHFRIATHGGVSQGKCHPFPATADLEALNALEWQFHAGVAHNGIISHYAGEGVSDTQGFIQAVLSNPIILNNIADKSIQELMRATISWSKICVLRPGNVALMGDWIKDKGVYYSNDSYKVKLLKEGDKDYWKNKPLGYWRSKDYEPKNTTVWDEKLHEWCDFRSDCFDCPYYYWGHDSDNGSCEVWDQYVSNETEEDETVSLQRYLRSKEHEDY